MTIPKEYYVEKEINEQINKQYSYVYRCDGHNLRVVLNIIAKNNRKFDKILLFMPSTKDLTEEAIDLLPDNVSVRISGAYTLEYLSSLDDYEQYPTKTIYNKAELKAIIRKFNEMEAGIKPEWNNSLKAIYLYEMLKQNIASYNLVFKEIAHNTDSLKCLLTGNFNDLSIAFVLQELMTRNGISCTLMKGTEKIKVNNKNVSIPYNWNIITIGGKNVLIDLAEDVQNFSKGIDSINGFGGKLVNNYTPNYNEQIQKRCKRINPEQVANALNTIKGSLNR